jgi:hypothetical protein
MELLLLGMILNLNKQYIEREIINDELSYDNSDDLKQLLE